MCNCDAHGSSSNNNTGQQQHWCTCLFSCIGEQGVCCVCTCRFYIFVQCYNNWDVKTVSAFSIPGSYA